MFAVVAALLFVLGIAFGHVHPDNYVFWFLLALASWALHSAFGVGLPRLTATRQAPPPQA